MSTVIYYKDFVFDKLSYGKAIKSHLGSLHKYHISGETQGIRIQFPKVKIIESDEGTVTLDFGERRDFFDKLSNATQGVTNKLGKSFWKFNSDPGRICMKINEKTLYFTDKNCITTYNDVRSSEHARVVVIASTEGLWISENSYGNTWIIDQMKIYPVTTVAAR